MLKYILNKEKHCGLKHRKLGLRVIFFYSWKIYYVAVNNIYL